ncbi:uncharacterized protein [Aristolochia californica]|uniref:uncharacterized protein n=1 Tax=Aristolochia californica TaxID=171875 RepID=UPI0035DB5C8E
MGEQCSETSIAISSSTPNWWELHSSPQPSWSNPHPWQPRNPPSNSSCEEDISISTSFTNASNHSCLSDDSPRDLPEPTSAATADLPGGPASENHLWSEVLLGIGTSKDLRSGQDDNDNFLAALTSKNLTTEMFEPPYDYMKKAENSWEFSRSPAFHSMEKQLNNYDGSSMEHESSANLTDLVNWSIAPPDPQLSRQITPSACNISLNSSSDRYPEAGLIPQMKQEQHNSSLYSGNGPFAINGNPSYFQCYGHELKGENQHQDLSDPPSSFTRPMSSVGLGYSHGPSVTGENSKHYSGLSDVPWSQTRHFADLISFGGCLSKPLMDLQASTKHSLKGSIPPESKKQGQDISLTRGNGKGAGTPSEGKKKRSEDNSETLFKKPKNEGSTASSPKVQAPKVKLGDRIPALQQIVSPFGKTDTASVLLEAIGYIKFLQEQVQLLSNPYLKSGASKDHTSWGGLERDNSEAKPDLRSRGLCLVPISCTPQIYRENTGPDYWTPTYRGCLYR